MLLRIVGYFIFSAIFVTPLSIFANTLSLPEAEHLALTNSPELRSLEASKLALEQKAVADGQLPDPQFTIGAIDVPTDTFSFDQDDMTMVQFGLQQTFLPGHSLKYKSQKTKDLSKAMEKRQQTESLDLLRKVRNSWLELYYWTHVKEIFDKNIALYQYLLKSVSSQYSVGKVTQSDVLEVQLELSRLQDQRIQFLQQIDLARADLSRWVGLDDVDWAISSTLPQWPNPPALSTLNTQIQQHPLLKMDAENIDAAKQDVNYAKEQYKPGWMLEADYGIRQGYMQNGMRRSNMVTMQATIDLPFFTGKRQSKEFAASTSQLLATEMDRQTHYRDLSQELQQQYAIWQRLSERDVLYQEKLIPESIQNSRTVLAAYSDAKSDLSTVLRAYSNELTAQMELLQIQMTRAKARVDLLYLQGTMK